MQGWSRLGWAMLAVLALLAAAAMRRLARLAAWAPMWCARVAIRAALACEARAAATETMANAGDDGDSASRPGEGE